MFPFNKILPRFLLCSSLFFTAFPAFALINYTVDSSFDSVAIGGSGLGNNGELRYVLNQILNDQAQGHSDTRNIQFNQGLSFISIFAPLPMINLFQEDTITINSTGDRPSLVLFGSNGPTRVRPFFIAGGTVTINDITFESCGAVGGTGGDGTWGGGGGMGAGGAVFVDKATVIMQKVAFLNCLAKGGQGGNGEGVATADGAGGGGGLGGKGGNGGDAGAHTGGGGGGGYWGNGGNANNGASGAGGGCGNGGDAGTNGAGPGGGGAIIGADGGSGDATAGTAVGSFVFGGGGAGATATLTTGGTGGGGTPGPGGTSIGGGGGGGYNGSAGLNGPGPDGFGGTGGVGGGGGGAGAACASIADGGGRGGRGAGGGGASPGSRGGDSLYGGGNAGHCNSRPAIGGGQGGFSQTALTGTGLGGGGGGSIAGETTAGDFGGGGGGSGDTSPSIGGIGAGNGGQHSLGGGAAGGGGLGCGGAVFVNNGGTVIFQDSIKFPISGNTVSAGTGGSGTTPGYNGFSCGSFLQILTGASVTFAPEFGATFTIADTISDDSAHSIPGDTHITAGSAAGAKIVLNGVGTLLLTGSNSYAGGTDLYAGTLMISSGSSLGTGQLHCLGNATLTSTGGSSPTLNLSPNILVDNPNTLTIRAGTSSTLGITSPIEGSGKLILSSLNSGAILLGSANTYTGGTEIQNGTIKIDANNVFGGVAAGTVNITDNVTLFLNNSATLSEPFVVAANKTLIFDTNANSCDFQGSLSGSAGLLLLSTGAGAGTLSFSTTAPTYTGPTQILNNTLDLQIPTTLGLVLMDSLSTLNVNASPVQIGILEGAGSISMGTNQLTVASQQDSTFAGTLLGDAGSSFQKTGTASLVLSGDNTGFSGNTTVSNGTLSINNGYGVAATTFTVNSGATLRGIGTIHSNVASSGIVAPGNSIGTLTVQNYTLDIEGTLSIELSPTASSLLNVVNTATINTPATLSVTEETGNYFAGTTFTVLTAGTSLTGASNFTITSVDPRFQWTLDLSVANTIRLLLLNDVLIGISPELIAQLGGNNLVLANYLNSLQNFEPLQNVLGQLASLSLAELEFALSTINPARNAFATFATQNLTFTLSNTILNRFAQHRLYRKAKKENLLASLIERRPLFAYNVKRLTPSPTPVQEAKTPEVLPEKETSYGVWVTGLGEFSHNKAQKQTPAFGVHEGGLLVGFDAFDFEHLFVGGAIGYAKLNIHQGNGFGSSHLNDFLASLYTSFAQDHFYLDAIVWGGYVQGHNKRNLQIPSIPSFSATAKSHYKAFQLTPHLGAGGEWTVGRNVFSPFVQLDWAISFERKLQEHGADPLNMNQKSRTSSMLQTEAGLQLYQIFQGKSGAAFYLREKGSFINKTPFRTGRITAAIVGAPTGFSVTTLTRKLNLGATAFEMIYKSKKDLFVSLDYEGQFGSGYRSQDIMGKIGKEF